MKGVSRLTLCTGLVSEVQRAPLQIGIMLGHMEGILVVVRQDQVLTMSKGCGACLSARAGVEKPTKEGEKRPCVAGK
jgi:hypothetical protein